MRQRFLTNVGIEASVIIYYSLLAFPINIILVNLSSFILDCQYLWMYKTSLTSTYIIIILLSLYLEDLDRLTPARRNCEDASDILIRFGVAMLLSVFSSKPTYGKDQTTNAFLIHVVRTVLPRAIIGEIPCEWFFVAPILYFLAILGVIARWRIVMYTFYFLFYCAYRFSCKAYTILIYRRRC